MFRLKILMIPFIVGVAMVLASTNPVWAQAEKMTICHMDPDTQSTETIRIPVGTYAVHMNNHGDITGACPGELDKVEICHQAPPGRGKMFTLLVDADEEQEHLDHGDSAGPC